jgi:hypothetical protein
VSPTWPDLLQDNQVRVALLLLGVAGLFSLIFRDRPASTPRDTEQDVRRPTNTALWRRWWWNLRPPHDVMRVDGLVIDRSRKPHCAWLGPTGAGKSASVATVRLDGKRVALVATPDLSDPLVDAIARQNGFRWTACVSTNPVNFLIGSPTEVAERLTEVFRSGGVGAWKRAARRATADVIRQIDAQGEPRTLRLIGERLEASVKADRELRTVCAGWVARFLDLADQFGTSIGPDGVDIADLLNRGISVLLDNDSFDHPSLGGDVVALGLAEAKRCASLVPGGFRLIFEEAGQLGERIDLAEPFHRAGRRRKIAVDDLTQAESDLNDGISANISTRVYFAQELKALQKIAADRLGLPHTHLDPANMRDFSAYISHGKIRRLVKFPKPPKSSYVPSPTPIPTDQPYARRTVVIEQIGCEPEPEHPALPLPPLEVREVLLKIDRTQGECWLWTGSIDKDGYGVQRWAYPDGRPKNNRPAHQVVWEIANGRWFPVGEWDHRRSCPRHCVNPYHGEPVSKKVNVQRMHRTRGHVTAD